MNANIIFSALTVSALILGNAAVMNAQDAANVSAQGNASAAGDDAVVFPSLTGASRENVEVWRLTCTTTPLGFVQTARARIVDRGGADGRLLYFHLTRTTTGATGKRTAPDGGISAFVSVGSGGAGSSYLIQVSKDRNAQIVLGLPIAEPYTLQAECIAGGLVRPHTLALIQNR
jgi:hypothetical protein